MPTDIEEMIDEQTFWNVIARAEVVRLLSYQFDLVRQLLDTTWA